MTTWFTSDQHYGHRNIIQHSSRPFADLADMHEAMITRHNAIVADDDTVYHLGDFAIDERLVKTFLPQLRGHHHLISGNHDKCHPCHKKHVSEAIKYAAWGFLTVQDRAEAGGFLLCHLPYEGDSANEGRYPEFRPKDDGRWLLHGHVHELWKVKDRMINVGVDQWDFAPVSIGQLVALVAQRQGATRGGSDGSP